MIRLRPHLATMARQAQNLALMRHRPGPLPHAIIIGAQKAGTTSLFETLARHPQLSPARRKEVHFADRNWHRGTGWYRRLFVDRPGTFAIEATPNYLFFPHAASRLAGVVPGVRLIALLRDPVARAVSHHRHERRRGGETLPFAEAIAAEPGRAGADWDRALAEPGFWSRALQHNAYLRRGLYAGHLARWRAHFPAGQLLVLDSARLYREPQATLGLITDFLGLAPAPGLTLAHANPGGGRAEAIPEAVTTALYARFAGDARELVRAHGRDFSWLSRCGIGDD